MNANGIAANLARNPVVGGVLVLGGVIAFAWWMWGEKLAALGNKFNPASPDNLASQAANALTQAVTGNEHSTLGTAIYDLFHPEPSVSPIYLVIFPDGAKHAVDSKDVQAGGVFVYSGVRYRLDVRADGKRYAIRLSSSGSW